MEFSIVRQRAEVVAHRAMNSNYELKRDILRNDTVLICATTCAATYFRHVPNTDRDVLIVKPHSFVPLLTIA